MVTYLFAWKYRLKHLIETRFPMPTRAMDEPWYSFDFGVLHYIMISTEHAFAPTSPQFDFVMAVCQFELLKSPLNSFQDLASINRTLTPWVIFAGNLFEVNPLSLMLSRSSAILY